VLALAKAANDLGHLPQSSTLAQAIAGRDAGEGARTLVKALADAGNAVLVLGETAVNARDAATLRAAARFVALATGSACNEIPAGANAIGLARAGVLPREGGRDAAAMLATPPAALLAWHAGSQDTLAPAAYDRARSSASFHVYVGAYACSGVQRTAHAVLPIGLPPEIDGTFTNVDGFDQIVAPAAKLPGDAKQGWKVLRALGAALSLPGFDFMGIEELRERHGQGMEVPPASQANNASDAPASAGPGRFDRIATTSIYRADAVLRRSPALQAHPLNRAACVTLHPEDALALGLGHGSAARVNGIELPVELSPRVPRGAAWIEAGHAATAALPPHGAALDIVKA
jgi:NADH-quinone oxidoreductase subunit G